MQFRIGQMMVLAMLPALAAGAFARVPDPAECVNPYDIPASIKCYTAVIGAFGEDTPPAHRARMHQYRALLYAATKEPGKALADYDKAIAADDGSPKGPNAGKKLLCERAGVYKQLGDYRKALADYRACAAAGNAWAESAAGEMQMALGDARGAIAGLTRAIEKGDGSALAYARRAKAYRRAGEFEKASGDADKAAELAPDDADVLYLRARTRLDAGDAAGALKDLGRIEKITGSKGQHAACRGLAAYLLGDREAAEKYFEEALGQGEEPLYLACYWWGIKRDAAGARAVVKEHGRPKGAPAVPPGLAGCLKGLKLR